MKNFITHSLLLFLLFCILFQNILQAQTMTLQSNWWAPSLGTSEVKAIAKDEVNNIIYIGGDFNYIGPPKFNWGAINITTGDIDMSVPSAQGIVYACVADGNGGWYIGGSFTSVEGITRNRVAQIDASGNLTSFNPNADGTVRTLMLVGTTLYVGGDFTNIGGQVRPRLAALNITTGLANSWNPSPGTGNVHCMTLLNNTMFIGGSFTSVGTETRQYIASVDISTGLPTSWNPQADTDVYTLAISGDTVFAGGSFTYVGGISHKKLVAVDINTGIPYSWSPSYSSSVYITALLVKGDTLLVGGNNTFKAYDIPTLTEIWNPTVTSGSVSAFALNNDTLFVAGGFSTISGQSRECIATIDLANNNVTPWNPKPSNSSHFFTIGLSNNMVYVGGDFYGIGGDDRAYIAALDGNTGKLTDWNPEANGVVDAIAIAGNKIYAGGTFTNIGGQNRNYLSAIDATSGLATTWNPNPSQSITALASDNNSIYVAGAFATIAGQSRTRMAAFNTSTDALLSWAPSPNSSVSDMLIDGNTMYVGGAFTIIGGQSRSRIASIDIVSGSATSWNPGANGTVYGIAKINNTIYAGGTFTSIGGASREKIGAIDATSGIATSFDPDASSYVYAVAASDNTVFAGGIFDGIGGETIQRRLAGLNPSSGIASWEPYVNQTGSEISALLFENNRLYIGGIFTTVEGQLRNSFAVFGDISGCSAGFQLYPDPGTPHNWFVVNICSGATPISYEWNWGDGNTSTGTNPSHTYDTPGYYNICVTMTDGNGCTDTYCDNSTYIYKTAEMITINVVDQLPVSITETENNKVKIYPNPTNNSVTIETEQGKGIYKLQDVSGKVFLSGSITAPKFSLDISALAKGIYMLDITDGKKQVHEKIVKQ